MAMNLDLEKGRPRRVRKASKWEMVKHVFSESGEFLWRRARSQAGEKFIFWAMISRAISIRISCLPTSDK